MEEGLEAALAPARRTTPCKLRFDGRFEARLIALACSLAPEGRSRWTMRLLTQKAVELQITPAVSAMTVCRTLKNYLQPHLSKYWNIPPDGNAVFAANIEDVLDLYHLPYEPLFPVVCMDESNRQLVGEVHEPLPMASGQIRTEDHEYVRNGVADIFIEVEPLVGRRHIEISAQWLKGVVKNKLEQDGSHSLYARRTGPAKPHSHFLTANQQTSKPANQ